MAHQGRSAEEPLDYPDPDSAGLGQASQLSWQINEGRLSIDCTRRDTYPVVVTDNLSTSLPPLLRGACEDRCCDTVFVVLDRAVSRLRERVEALVVDANLRLAGVELVDGHERGKSLVAAERLWRRLQGAGMPRRGLVLAIGGGVTCDLAGFVASNYMRGLPYLLVPTSVMAQVDAAVGGKVGVDFLDQKNLLGAFFHPVGVIADVTLLRSLPDRMWAAGLAEAVKIAMIGSAALFALLEANAIDRLRADETTLRAVVELSICEKLRHLAPDPHETRELRRLLNFGHCVGHALEAELGFRWLHGECVAVGMAVASRVGVVAGITSEVVALRLVSLLDKFELPTRVPLEHMESVWMHLERIRLVRNGRLNLVVPTDVGQADVLDEWPASVRWAEIA